MAETFLNWEPIIIAFAGGILPALLWLWFWNEEDHKAHEPAGLLALSFVAGMAVVYFVLPVQKLVVVVLPAIMHGLDLLANIWAFVVPSGDIIQTVLWAFIEEFGKLATVFLVAYHTRYFDEPMDAVIYLITAALGFAAMENTLYILKDLASGGGLEAIINGNLRFIGATILHIASSALLGLAFAFAFYNKFFVKVIAGTLGLILATLLHVYFNLSIMDTQGTIDTLVAFTPFWIVIVLIIILLEFVKRLKPPHLSSDSSDKARATQNAIR